MKRAALCVGLICGACGGGTVEAPHVDPVPTVTAHHEGPHMRVAGQLGSIDEAATKNTFAKLSDPFQTCQTSGLKRIDYLAGDVKFFLRIGEDGRAKWGYLEKSTLGDIETEKCLMNIAMGASWPVPDGGEAEIQYDGLGFDPPSTARLPTDWPSDKIATTLGKHGEALNKCVDAGKGAKFTVTAYVVPGGKVQSVGVATNTKDGAEQIDCIVSAVKAMKMPTPGSWAAKVAFQL